MDANTTGLLIGPRNGPVEAASLARGYMLIRSRADVRAEVSGMQAGCTFSACASRACAMGRAASRLTAGPSLGATRRQLARLDPSCGSEPYYSPSEVF